MIHGSTYTEFRTHPGYIFGLARNSVLLGRVSDLAEDAAIGRIDGTAEKVRGPTAASS